MSRLRSFYSALVIGLAIFSGALLVFITVGIGAEAIMRSLGLGFIRGIVDIAEYSMFNIAILAAPWIATRNGHIWINIVTSQLPPLLANLLAVAINGLGAALCAVAAYYGTLIFIQSVERGEYIFQELVIPEWWLQWQVPLAFALLTVDFIRCAGVSAVALNAEPQKGL